MCSSDLNASEDHRATKRRKISSTKIKRNREPSSEKCGSIGVVNEQLAEQGPMRSLGTTDRIMEEQELPSSSLHADHLPAYCEDDHLDSMEELGSNQNDKQHSVINQHAFSKPLQNRQRRFGWTDADDR